MISLKITDSTDEAAVGELLVGHNELIFGRREGTILIDDPGLQNIHARLVVSENNELTISPASPGASIAVGGRLINDPLSLEKESIFQMARTSVQVIDFQFSLSPGGRVDASKFIPGSSERRILDIIEEESQE